MTRGEASIGSVTGVAGMRELDGEGAIVRWARPIPCSDRSIEIMLGDWSEVNSTRVMTEVRLVRDWSEIGPRLRLRREWGLKTTPMYI